MNKTNMSPDYQFGINEADKLMLIIELRDLADAVQNKKCVVTQIERAGTTASDEFYIRTFTIKFAPIKGEPI